MIARAFAVGLAAIGPGAAVAGSLAVEADGATVARLEIAAGAGWCLRWNHSVTGGPVADCFVARDGWMVLERSFLHDYAAGLGEVPGRGEVRAAAGGGYWIEGIGEPIGGNALPLRVGRASVDHRLTTGGRTLALSDRFAGRRVLLRYIP